MRRFFFPLILIPVLCIFLFSQTACDKKVGKQPQPVPVPVNICDSATYSIKIKKMIETNCAITDCHVSGFGSGDFTNYDGLKNKVDAGSFKDRVFNQPDNPMPPVSNGGMLSADKLKLIECWLNKGAKND